MSLFQSNLRKQIRNLPKILNFVKKIHYYSELFTSLLNQNTSEQPSAANPASRRALGEARSCPWIRRARAASRIRGRCRRSPKLHRNSLEQMWALKQDTSSGPMGNCHLSTMRNRLSQCTKFMLCKTMLRTHSRTSPQTKVLVVRKAC